MARNRAAPIRLDALAGRTLRSALDEEAEVDGAGAVGERADGDEVDAGVCDIADAV